MCHFIVFPHVKLQPKFTMKMYFLFSYFIRHSLHLDNLKKKKLALHQMTPISGDS